MNIETNLDRFVNTENGLINLETGEIIELDENGKPKKFEGREPAWFKGIKNGFIELSKMKMAGTDYAVCINIFGRIKYGNHLTINQTKLAEQLDMSRASVNRSLQVLQDRGIIVKIERSSKSTDYIITKAFCWCGNNTKKNC